MTEIISNKLNPDVFPHLAIWNWEIPVYLFLGGLAGGLLILSSGLIILKKDAINNQQVKLASLLAPLLLSVGMLFLFLDLTYKLHVWRFYTWFNFTAPMSWGSWMLLIFFPFSMLQAMLGYRNLFDQFPVVRKWLNFAQPHLEKIAVINLHVGTGIGVYTGILLSSFYARPLWSSSILGFVFLLSGLSSAAALLLLLAPKKERKLYLKTDMYLISLEGFATTIFILGGITASENIRNAMIFLISGTYAPWFWIVFVFGGMIIPLLLETLEVYKKVRYSPIIPVLVLAGSLTLRFVIVQAGQVFPTFS
ncbi:MAG: polysulfide reductase NrfD [Proteobacteria bacterium]|nr:polysulfide reductase NrfD [Pseudomonadota bacterium]